jgi:NADH-quinone oxidoreductase subunit L
MTHAFFKALLFLGSGSVIHAMAGEQDMRRMGGLRKYMPVTFVTMLIGTLAIAGIFPLSGFFSKDEILLRAFVANKAIWVLAVITAFMTAFYMARLMAMTFFGGYRGPAWESAHGQGAHGHDAHTQAPHGGHDAQDVSNGGHGHGAWHGPHESPSAMTLPLQVLAIGACVAGFVGIPAALGVGSAIEKFLEPSFTAHAAAESGAPVAEAAAARTLAAEPAEHEEPHVSRGVELGLMGFSLLVAVCGITLARKLYVTKPELSDRLAVQWAGAHRVLSNKYYVDELYDATVISGTFSAGRSLWAVDRNVVDGVVNGSGWVTIVSAWFSGLTDRTIVDGVVNLVGRICEEGSFWFRRVQTGLVQNYAMLMLFGIFAFVSIYLFMR